MAEVISAKPALSQWIFLELQLELWGDAKIVAIRLSSILNSSFEMNSYEENQSRYQRKDVVEHYEKQSELQAAEAYAFEKYVGHESLVLDIGVGGGRTTAFLSGRAKYYVGVDYVYDMVVACKRRFPALDFFEADAKNLSRYGPEEFDVVVFSFNGIDHFLTDRDRIGAMKEVRRVLKPGGYFIFSSHNARCLFTPPILRGATAKQKLWRTVRCVVNLGVALLTILPTRSFFSGSGYLSETTHGGLSLHASTPGSIENDLRGAKLDRVEVMCAPSLATRPFWSVPWYYYVAQRK
jgi:SAM-dependent methyltransferase